MRVNLGNLSKEDEGERFVTVSLTWNEVKALCTGGIIRSRLINEAISIMEQQTITRFGIDIRNSMYSSNGHEELMK